MIRILVSLVAAFLFVGCAARSKQLLPLSSDFTPTELESKTVWEHELGSTSIAEDQPDQFGGKPRPPRPGPGFHWVSPHQKDGKIQAGYWRTNRNSTVTDNFGFHGNLNPKTGKVGTRTEGMTYVPPYQRKDGTEVSGYWRNP